MTKKEDIAEAKAEKKAAKEAKAKAKLEDTQSHKLEIAKAKNPIPTAYGDSSSILPGGNETESNSGGINWIWIAVLAGGAWLAWKAFRNR